MVFVLSSLLAPRAATAANLDGPSADADDYWTTTADVAPIGNDPQLVLDRANARVSLAGSTSANSVLTGIASDANTLRVESGALVTMTARANFTHAGTSLTNPTLDGGETETRHVFDERAR